uniref:uncharacterized protein LOC124007537 n=1 Tax=Oncorhynchus gorbuscha TaxID=8017 RepID=UPI001EAF03AC|nr:uncharacterized protein LOC124007537 [Oncorhynchus gorbuscha]
MFSIPPNIAAFPIMSVSTKECLLVHYWSSAPLVLLLLCSGCFADSRVRTSGNITAKIGHPVTLSCEPPGDGNVSQVEWRIGGCDGRRILVSNTNNPVVVEQDYIDRVSAVTMRGFTLLGTQRNDAGPYCCSLTTFPLGSLKCHLFLYLTEDPQTAFSESPLIMIVSIASGILGVLVLGGTITALLLCQRCRRPVQDPVHVAVHPGGLPQKPPSILQKSQAHAPPPQRSNSEEEEEEENGEMDYLNITVLRLPRIPPTASSALRKS